MPECRNFLVRVLDWVPRNYNYEDGLRIIHPQLQERFGDENVDLACGVLHELIEVDVYNPFPGSSYQRWKYTHRHRNENLMLPHVPHTTTIMARVVPTKTLLEWRAKNDATKAIKTNPILPTSPTFKTGISTITHRSAWRIEHTLFVSIGGAKASVYHCPSPEEFHQRLWDPEYGRGGNMAGVKTHTLPHPLIRIGSRASISPDTHLGNPVDLPVQHNTRLNARKVREARLLQAKAAQLARMNNRRECTMLPPIGFQNATYEELVSTRVLHNLGSKPPPANFSSVRNVPLPTGVLVPNAIFARKYQVVPDEAPLPDCFLRGQIQPTADQLAIAKVEHLRDLVSAAMDETRRKHKDLKDEEVLEQEDILTKEYFSFFKGPFTADLFYDSGLDFKWSISPDNSPSVSGLPVMAHNTAAFREKRGIFSSLSPAKRQKKPATTMNSKHSSSAERQERRRKQIMTVSGKSQLIEPQVDRTRFRDSRLFGVFQRRKAVSSPKKKQVSYYRKNLTDSEKVELPETESLTCHDAKPSSLSDDSTAVKDETSESLLSKQLSTAVLVQQNPRNISSNICRTPPKTPKTPTPSPRRIPRPEPLGRFPLHELSGIFLLSNVERETGETLKPIAYTESLPGDDFGAERRLREKRSDLGAHGFDGTVDEVGCSKVSVNSQNTAKVIPQSRKLHRIHFIEITSLYFCTTLSFMDPRRGLLHRSATPKPLKINKQSTSQSRAAKNYHQMVNHNTNLDNANVVDDQLLPSTVYNAEDSYDPAQHNSAHNPSTIEGGIYPSSLSGSTPQRLIPDTTSGIMGDFVALAPVNIKSANEGSDIDIELLTVAAKHRYPKPSKNTYEFERSPLLDNLDDEGHLGKFRDFMREQEREHFASPGSPSKASHSRGYGNTIPTVRKDNPSPIGVTPSSRENTIARSESSPVMSPSGRKLQYYARYQATQNPHPRYYTQDEMSQSPSRRKDEGELEVPRHSRRRTDEDHPELAYHTHRGTEGRSDAHATAYEHFAKYPPRTSSRSPTRQHRQESLRDSFSGSSYYDRTSGSTGTQSRPSDGNYYQGRSPVKGVVDLSEDGVFEDEISRPDKVTSPSSSPPKRARSPMKKMFGENGWLSNTPITNQEAQFPPPPRINKPKKPTMMGKLRNKFEEMAEKADLTPKFRNSPDKDARRPKQPSITRSISPFEQARIYTELELMMVHTANMFLMNEFSQARIGIDTIRKTIDSWKSKGRPMVTEFMYDQITQRNLVGMNQNSLRFHGPEAGNEIRINSMLYNWKQVANQMAIRTFCDTDPIILKLLFDIENILELLGAGEPFMLRLQQISTGVKGTIHAARQNKSTERERMDSKNQQSSTVFG
ncbi:hypothetical protein BP5796_04050 [Coleophoma crateriformis]|uniref:Uncharacterized protein n=1 Tax=Coleophoma crateriformis TaxID=565419 RepID=A0A3D8SHA0_9HELO|nr:hypothetical protein BP5796_04050 [Coleophoma crateriformis]